MPTTTNPSPKKFRLDERTVYESIECADNNDDESLKPYQDFKDLGREYFDFLKVKSFFCIFKNFFF